MPVVNRTVRLGWVNILSYKFLLIRFKLGLL